MPQLNRLLSISQLDRTAEAGAEAKALDRHLSRITAFVRCRAFTGLWCAVA